MKTEGDLHMVSGIRAGADPSAPVRPRPAAKGEDGVIAVIVERDDGTCTVFCRGTDRSWPSMEQARESVEDISSGAVWRQTTPGVWVARRGVADPPICDRGPGRGRRSEVSKTTRSSGQGDTYMAALVLRGITGPGQPGALLREPIRGRHVA